jgi:rubrerythrin
MAFTDPFPGLKTPLSNEDMIRALRLDLSLEQDAISVYTAHAKNTDNIMVKTILRSIADEEKVHAGEILRVIEVLTGDEADFMLKGAHEVESKFPNLRYNPKVGG